MPAAQIIILIVKNNYKHDFRAGHQFIEYTASLLFSPALGANDLLAGQVFSAPLNMTAVLNKDSRTKEHNWGCVGQPCVPGDVLAICLHVEKTLSFAKLEVLPHPLGSC